MDEKKYENKCLKRLIITNNIESINGLKAVCPICVKSRRLSRNNGPRERYRHAQKRCEKGILGMHCTAVCGKLLGVPLNILSRL